MNCFEATFYAQKYRVSLFGDYIKNKTDLEEYKKGCYREIEKNDDQIGHTIVAIG